MNGLWTFEKASAFWRHWHKTQADGIWDELMSAERHILDHSPQNPLEAEFIVTVLIDNLDRSDGRDVAALERLRTYLGRLAMVRSTVDA